ncbi:hypothetical protein SAY87_006587 [Trapa incisa]|uniref:DUF6737 domain-containing protein n=1 Tax=Trapa incisa TaxID=236973 RepID=A0AAN7K2M3_9MYRT|nr:hypothetical protein SAY87_006587 [Trapa incisa]
MYSCRLLLYKPITKLDLGVPKMAMLSLFSFCLPPTSSPLLNLHFTHPRASIAPGFPRPSSRTGQTVTVLHLPRQSRARAGGNSRNEDVPETMFIDESNVVDDMEGYLNYLSPEYESVWDTKPSWCQPWTITLTGVLAIAFSWAILQSVLVTAIVALLICSWWYIFLYSYPKVLPSPCTHYIMPCVWKRCWFSCIKLNTLLC